MPTTIVGGRSGLYTLEFLELVTGGWGRFVVLTEFKSIFQAGHGGSHP